VKVAIIGRGFGQYAMAPAFESLGWEVEIVSSRDSGTVNRAIEGPVDLISIHSPPFQHREHVLQAIAAGRDVLCDKPFGRNAAEAREMRDAAGAAGVLHFLNFEFRHNAARRKVLELLQAGAIGKLQHVSYASFANYMQRRDYGWLNDGEAGGGWLGALGSHVIDAMRCYFASEVVDCGGVARMDMPLRSDGKGGQTACTAEDAFSVWLTFANGGSVTINAASSTAATLPQRVQFLGSEGAIELVDDHVSLIKHRAEPQLFDFTAKPGDPAWPALHDWLADVTAAVKSRQQIAPSFDDGVAVAEVMDQLKINMVRPAAN
jgi:predicted dehydrogenase